MQIFNIVEELEKERKKNKELEKEINRLTAESTHYESKYYNEAKKVDKAVEYIEQYDSMTAIVKKTDEEGIFGFDGNFGIKEELLGILKGDNK